MTDNIRQEAERLHDAMHSWISAKFPREHTVHVIETAIRAAVEAEREKAKGLVRALEELLFAYINKDEPPHDFEIKALKLTDEALAAYRKSQQEAQS